MQPVVFRDCSANTVSMSSSPSSPASPSPSACPGEAFELSVNGESRTVAAGCTVADLLAELQLDPRVLAVERNLELVPRRQHAETPLAAGDRLEIVTLVGGG